MKILVLDVPALHLGYLGCYGNDWVATPDIDRLASESVVFDRHIYDVAQPDPLAWTGHHPLPDPEPLPFADVPTLGKMLEDIGPQFISEQGAVSLETLQDVVAQTSKALGHRQSFTWVRFPSLAPPWNLPHDLLNSYCEEEDEPWPDPPQGVVENPDDLLRLQNTYAAVVTYVDAQLGMIIDQVRHPNHREDMLVCLTASHGLPLGEHGAIGYVRPWLHEELVHLPLLMRLPRGERAGLRVDGLTQPVDLFATLLEFLAIAPPPSHGRSLGPLIRDEVNQIRLHACSGMRSGHAVEWALRSRDWALLLPVANSPEDPSRRAQLYAKPEDRWEVNDVRQHHLELAEDMETKLWEYAAESRKPGPLSR